jgi:protein involved in polysaccharide export with SLBB domain
MYTRAQGMKVSDLIYAAGGLVPGAGPEVQWVQGHYEGPPKPVLLHLTGDAADFKLDLDPVLNDDDTVGVGGRGDFTAQPEMVSIDGEVEHPGSLALPQAAGTQTFTAWDLLQQGGKLLPDACLSGLIVYRSGRPAKTTSQADDLTKVLQGLNGQAHQEQTATPAVNAAQMSAALTQNVTQGMATVLSQETGVSIVMPPLPVEVTQAVSGIPLDGDVLVATRGARGNLTLQDGDYLYVPKQPATVTVLGAVARSGAIPLLPTTGRRAHAPTAEEYVAQSGGFRDDADAKHLVVVHLNGSVTVAVKTTPLRPGDVLVVPSRYVVRNVRTESELDSWLKAIVPLVTTALIVKS